MARNVSRPRRPYRTGDEDLDAKIAELVGSDGAPRNADLLAELLTSCFRLVRHEADRGEIKLANAALKEFVYAFRVFRKFRGTRKVSIFGSSRSGPDDPNYQLAQRFAEAMARDGWMVITGAGPGIMEAGHRGAGAKLSFGANIRLPMEATANEIIEGDPKLINFKYFFTRKVTFLKEAHAFALFPGGYGTLDEAFELLTLMQTGKSDIHPIVLLEAPESTYWRDWQRFISTCLVERDLISPEDMDLLKVTERVDDATTEIERFYRNYQSQRYVGGRLVLRLLRVPPEEALRTIAREYKDIVRGPITVVEPSPQEVVDDDALDCQRISLNFNRRSHSRLRGLIDRLNEF